MSGWTLLCLQELTLSLRLILDARRSNQHFRVRPKFPMATWDSFTLVELHIGNLDGSEAPALHIASGDVQYAFSSQGYSRMASTFCCFRPLSALRIRHGEQIQLREQQQQCSMACELTGGLCEVARHPLHRESVEEGCGQNTPS